MGESAINSNVTMYIRRVGEELVGDQLQKWIVLRCRCP